MIKRQTLAIALSLRSSSSPSSFYYSMALLHGGADPSIISPNKLQQNPNHGFSNSMFRRNLSIRACSGDHGNRLFERIELKNNSNFTLNCIGNDLLSSGTNVVDCGSGIIGLNGDDQSKPVNARLANGHGGSACQRGTPNRLSTDKIVVAVDVDEVLGNFVSALNRFVADRYSSNHSVSEYYVYEFFRIWNCTRDEADMRVHEFFKTPYFKKGIHPIPGALRALQKVSSFCNLSVVTSRQNAIKDHTIQWIENHFPGLFQEIHFGNHFALEGQSRPKSDICRSLGAKVLIDDNPRYAMECAEVGIRVLLFDYEKSYPWCKIESVDQHPLVTKVHSWEEVEHQLVTWVFHQSFTYQ